jgi:hypothetical protein
LSHSDSVVPSGVVRQESQKRSSHWLHKLEQPLHIELEQPLHVHEQSLQNRSSHRSQHE